MLKYSLKRLKGGSYGGLVGISMFSIVPLLSNEYGWISNLYTSVIYLLILSIFYLVVVRYFYRRYTKKNLPNKKINIQKILTDHVVLSIICRIDFPISVMGGLIFGYINYQSSNLAVSFLVTGAVFMLIFMCVNCVVTMLAKHFSDYQGI